jgi:hypothetical protein
MKFHRKFLLISFSILFLVVLVWDFILYLLPSNTTVWNFQFNTAYGSIYLIGGIVATMYGISVGLKSNLGKMLLFFGLGQLSFAVGNAIWVYYNFILKVALPYPSWADLAYVTTYPFLALGTFFLVKIYQSLVNKKVMITSIIFSSILLTFIFFFFTKPDLSKNLSFVLKFLNVYYPASALAGLILALIALEIGGGKLHYSLYILSFGLLLLTAANLLFSYRTALGIYWNGDISDLSFAGAAYFISISLVEIINSLQQAKVKVEK